MNDYRCETCKKECKITVVDADDGKPVSFNPKDPIESTEWFVQGISQVGCASHSDFQRTKCAEILDDLATKIIEKRKDFQVPDKHGRCPEVPGFEWLLDYIGNKVAEEGGFVLTNIVELRQKAGEP